MYGRELRRLYSTFAGSWPGAGLLLLRVVVGSVMAADRLVCLLAGTVAGALAMLGPGRWSVDTRLFGWKRIDLGRRVQPVTRETHQAPERGPGIR